MKKVNEKALSVLDKAIMYGFSCDAFKKKPGFIIQKMSEKDKLVLQELTSHDTENQRPIFLE